LRTMSFKNKLLMFLGLAGAAGGGYGARTIVEANGQLDMASGVTATDSTQLGPQGASLQMTARAQFDTSMAKAAETGARGDYFTAVGHTMNAKTWARGMPNKQAAKSAEEA